MQKGLDFSVEAVISSAISFRLPSDSIPADAFSDSPLSSAFASDLSGPSIPRLSPLPFRFLTPSVFAFFRSLQFRVLTTQPLFFLSFSSRLRLTVASSVRPLRFRFLGFPRSLRPGFPCLPSRFLYSALLFVSFRPSLIRSHSCSSGAYFELSLSVFSVSLPLSFVRFTFGSDYSASASSFPLSSRFRLTVASSVRPLRSRFLGFPRSSQPGFPCFLSRFFVLGFLFVSFHPSRFRSHSRSTGASLLFRFLSSASLPGFPLAFCFLSSASARF